MEELTKNQLIEQLVIKSGKPAVYFKKWNKKDLYKVLHKTETETRIICNKLIGHCGITTWDGKGKKPDFWDSGRHETMDQCRTNCRSFMDIGTKQAYKHLPDKERNYLNTLVKHRTKRAFVYSKKYVLSNIDRKSYNNIEKLIIQTTDEYNLYRRHINEFFNVKKMLIDEKVDGNQIDTTLTPPKLTTLLLYSDNYNKPVVLREPLKKFKIKNNDSHQSNITFNLPKTLNHLSIDVTYNLPLKHEYLETLIFAFGSNFNQPITKDNLPNLKTFYTGWESDFNLPIHNLPRKISFLHIGGNNNYNEYLKDLPNTLTTIYLQGDFNKHLNRLPDNLHTLSLGPEFDNSLHKDDLPSKLENLILDNNQCDLNGLPSNLKFLSIDNLTEPLTDNLPSNLKHLSLQIFWNLENYIMKLPTNLERLTLMHPLTSTYDAYFDGFIDTTILPSNLRILDLGLNMFDVRNPLILNDLISRTRHLREITMIGRRDRSNIDFIDSIKPLLENAGKTVTVFQNTTDAQEYFKQTIYLIYPYLNPFFE